MHMVEDLVLVVQDLEELSDDCVSWVKGAGNGSLSSATRSESRCDSGPVYGETLK